MDCIARSVFGIDGVIPKWGATADEDGQYSFAVAL
jgi:hypothetical protein